MAANSRNVRNAESFLFKSLTKLLSGPLTDYRRQNPRQLRRHQLDKFKFKSASGQPFKKSSSNPLTQIYSNARNNQNRAERYIDFDQMEYDPLINAALDIYSDEMTVSSPLNKLLSVNCPNEEIKGILEHLYYSVMNIEFNLFGWCRNMCKYGDYFLYLDIDEKDGVKHFIGLPPMEIERLEGEDKTNPSYVQFQWNSGGITLENWQVGHFRILGNDKFAPYGTSILDGARRIWRQLKLLEDAMMAYRIVRSPERRVFYIDVGGIPEKDVEQHMQRIITDMKRSAIVDPESGQVDLRYNPMSVDEDYFIATIGSTSGTRIESLPGGTYTGDIDDVKYLRDNLLAALKIPHAYLVSTEGGVEDKTTLAQKDIEFARTIQRLQRSVIAELEKIGVIHLYILGYRGKDLLSFKLNLTNPSKITEMEELEHWKLKFEVAAAATDGFFSKRWVAKNVLGLSDEVYLRNTREMFFDAKLAAAIEKIAQGGAEGDLGDDLGDLGGDEGGTPGGEEKPEDQTLLAAPGKRHDPYLTPGSNGKRYTPELYDKRPSGARKRSMLGKASRELASSTGRNIFKGAADLRSLSRGIYEDLETNYFENIQKILSEEEKERELKILTNNKNIQLMIESLENKKDKTKLLMEQESNEI